MTTKREAVTSLWDKFCELFADSVNHNGINQAEVDRVMYDWKTYNPEYDREDYSVVLTKDEFVKPHLHFSESFRILFDEAREEVARG